MRVRNIYQIFPRAFTPDGTLNAAAELLPHLAGLGIDVVYLCPVVEADDDMDRAHWSERQCASGFDNPKNPYRMKDYFNVDPEFGTNDDLKRFVQISHKLGMKVILDLVYFHCGPAAVFLREHPDFVELDEQGKIKFGDWHFPILNFKNPQLREYLWDNMVYFVRDFDVDGYRCDVAERVPLDFWEEGRRRMAAVKPDTFMLAEANGKPADHKLAFEASYGFDFIHGLGKLLNGSIDVTAFRQILVDQHKRMPNLAMLRCFDNHDVASDSYDNRFDRACPPGAVDAALALCFSLDGVPMLYNGQEIADFHRHSLWANRDHGGNLHVDWSKAVTERGEERMELIRDLIELRTVNDVLASGDFSILDTDRPESILAFRRTLGADCAIGLFNFTNAPVTVCADVPYDALCTEPLSGRGARLTARDGKLCVDLLPYGWLLR